MRRKTTARNKHGRKLKKYKKKNTRRPQTKYKEYTKTSKYQSTGRTSPLGICQSRVSPKTNGKERASSLKTSRQRLPWHHHHLHDNNTDTHTHTHTNPNEKERASSSKMNQQITLAEPFARQKNNNNKNQLKTNINNEKERASPLKISQQRDSLGRTTCMTRRRKSKICTQRSTDCLFCSLGSLSRTTWYMLMLLPIRARNCKIKNGQNHLVFVSLFFQSPDEPFLPFCFLF